MENSGMKAWKGINIFENLSTEHHSVAKKLELSQMRLRYLLRSALISRRSGEN